MSRNIKQLVDPDSQLRTVFRCLIALTVVVTIGTVGFEIIEPDWGPWNSFFFTLITITTVGYGDGGLSENGQRFASVLLIVGIATATYSLGAIVRAAVQYQQAWKKKMQQKIDRLENHFVICGFGRIGATVCAELLAAGEEFVVIEQTDAACQAALDLGYPVVHGNSTEDDVLHQAGVARARSVVCVINSDAENVSITLCVRELNPDAFIVSRADAEGATRRLKRAGASLVISPYTTAGLTIANTILNPLDDEERIVSRLALKNVQDAQSLVREVVS